MCKNLAGIIIPVLFLFTACKKAIVTNEQNPLAVPANMQQKLLACETREDAARTAAAFSTLAAAGTTASSPAPVVLLLDFNGHELENSLWNLSGPVSCPAVPASLLTKAMKDYIFQSVTEDYSSFSVRVTKSEQEYQAAASGRRMRCVVTYNMSGQFGNIGGTAFISSLLWGDNTPCFVFCDILQYNQKYIAGSISHELGHSFGLQHQSKYAAGCQLEEEFHSGFGEGTLSWAPIMGLSYYKTMVTWHQGPSVLGCEQIQNDMELINAVSGVKADDYSATLNNNTIQLPSTGTKTGVLENAADKDAFRKNETNSKRIKVLSNGDSDIALEVYNLSGQLITVYDDLNSRDINVLISGKKYLRVRLSSTQPYVPAGNGSGGYIINITTP